MPERWQPGDVVALREVWEGRIFEARPAHVVLDEPSRHAFHLPAGAPVRMPVGADGDVLRVPQGEWRLEERPRGHRPVLSFAWPEITYAVLLFWNPDGTFGGWYINLQSPLRRSPVGFDYADHLLDVVVTPDRAWLWKDEDELEHAVRDGLVTTDQARAFRSASHDAIRRLEEGAEPFDDTWLDWRPDPSWPAARLAEGWDQLGGSFT